MNLLRSSIVTLFSVTTLFSATPTGAYNAYLDGSYSESLNAYRSIYKESGNRDALYGMINSLTALERYNEALKLCKTESDPILSAKEVWILGLQKEIREAKKSVSLSENLYTAVDNAVIYQSGGIGFQTSGKYREALRWFEKSYELSPNNNTLALKEQAIQQKKDAVIWSGTVGGGPIIYSKDLITERNTSYRYDKGYFFDVGSRWDIKKKHTVELIYSRFDASFQSTISSTDYFYGINYESELYHSLDSDQEWNWPTFYSVNDSLQRWQNSNPGIHKFVKDSSLDTSYYDNNGSEVFLTDTIYTLYEEHYLGSAKPGTQQGKYDTIITVSDEETFTPEPVFQNNLYLGYTQWYVRGRNLHLGGAANLLYSNIKGMKTGITLYGYHGHLTRNKYFLFNGNWYGTFTDQISVLQASPDVTAFFGPKVSLRITPTYTWKTNAPYIYNMPGVQLSCESALNFTTELLSLGGSVTIGKRAFVAESAGKHVVNITLPHKVTGTLSFSVTPGQKRVTLFTMGRYESYEQMSRLVAMGGLTVTL